MATAFQLILRALPPGLVPPPAPISEISPGVSGVPSAMGRFTPACAGGTGRGLPGSFRLGEGGTGVGSGGGEVRACPRALRFLRRACD